MTDNCALHVENNEIQSPQATGNSQIDAGSEDVVSKPTDTVPQKQTVNGSPTISSPSKMTIEPHPSTLDVNAHLPSPTASLSSAIEFLTVEQELTKLVTRVDPPGQQLTTTKIKARRLLDILQEARRHQNFLDSLANLNRQWQLLQKVKKLPKFSRRAPFRFLNELGNQLENMNEQDRKTFVGMVWNSDKVPLSLNTPLSNEAGSIRSQLSMVIPNIDLASAGDPVLCKINRILNPSKQIHDMVHTVKTVSILLSRIINPDLRILYTKYAFVYYRCMCAQQSFISNYTHLIIANLFVDPNVTYDSFVSAVIPMPTVLTAAQRAKIYYNKGKNISSDQNESSESTKTDLSGSNKRNSSSANDSKNLKRRRFNRKRYGRR